MGDSPSKRRRVCTEGQLDSGAATTETAEGDGDDDDEEEEEEKGDAEGDGSDDEYERKSPGSDVPGGDGGIDEEDDVARDLGAVNPQRVARARRWRFPDIRPCTYANFLLWHRLLGAELRLALVLTDRRALDLGFAVGLVCDYSIALPQCRLVRPKNPSSSSVAAATAFVTASDIGQSLAAATAVSGSGNGDSQSSDDVRAPTLFGQRSSPTGGGDGQRSNPTGGGGGQRSSPTGGGGGGGRTREPARTGGLKKTKPKGGAVGLFFYADHDAEPFVRFVDTIICDGTTTSLAQTLLGPLLTPEFFAANAKAFRATTLERLRRAGFGAVFRYHKVLPAALARAYPDRVRLSPFDRSGIFIKARIGGRAYVVGQTLSRSAYRWSTAYYCGDEFEPELAEVPHDWRCHHTIVVGYLGAFSAAAIPDDTRRKLRAQCKVGRGEERLADTYDELLYLMRLHRSPPLPLPLLPDPNDSTTDGLASAATATTFRSSAAEPSFYFAFSRHESLWPSDDDDVADADADELARDAENVDVDRGGAETRAGDSGRDRFSALPTAVACHALAFVAATADQRAVAVCSRRLKLAADSPTALSGTLTVKTLPTTRAETDRIVALRPRGVRVDVLGSARGVVGDDGGDNCGGNSGDSGDSGANLKCADRETAEWRLMRDALERLAPILESLAVPRRFATSSRWFSAAAPRLVDLTILAHRDEPCPDDPLELYSWMRSLTALRRLNLGAAPTSVGFVASLPRGTALDRLEFSVSRLDEGDGDWLFGRAPPDDHVCATHMVIGDGHLSPRRCRLLHTWFGASTRRITISERVYTCYGLCMQRRDDLGEWPALLDLEMGSAPSPLESLFGASCLPWLGPSAKTGRLQSLTLRGGCVIPVLLVEFVRAWAADFATASRDPLTRPSLRLLDLSRVTFNIAMLGDEDDNGKVGFCADGGGGSARQPIGTRSDTDRTVDFYERLRRAIPLQVELLLPPSPPR